MLGGERGAWVVGRGAWVVERKGNEVAKKKLKRREEPPSAATRKGAKKGDAKNAKGKEWKLEVAKGGEDLPDDGTVARLIGDLLFNAWKREREEKGKKKK